MAYKTSIKPFRLRQNRLRVQFSITVPSTKNNKEISKTDFSNRIDSEKRFIGEKFKGDTSINAIGSYLYKSKGKTGKLIKENVAIVEASTTPEIFYKKRNVLTNHIRQRKKEWKQQSILYKVEGETFIYPIQKQLPNEVIKKDIPIS